LWVFVFGSYARGGNAELLDMAGCFLARGIPRGETEKAEAGQPVGPGGVEARPSGRSRADEPNAETDGRRETIDERSMDAAAARFGE